jgi:hypothetical protein
VFFVDGDKACTPMSVPAELLDMMRDVATGRINHQAEPFPPSALAFKSPGGAGIPSKILVHCNEDRDDGEAEENDEEPFRRVALVK